MDDATMVRSVREDLDRHLRRCSSAIAATGRALADRIAFSGRPSEGDWSAQFSRLILLYPYFAARGAAGVGRGAGGVGFGERIGTALLGHMFLLIHSIIDDRQIDAQIETVPREMLAGRFFLLEGTRILRSLPTRDPRARERAFDALSRGYLLAQLESTEPADRPRSIRRLEALAARRAAPGAMAVVALDATTALDGAETGVACRLWKAFAALAVGYQWADDASDWKQDVARPDGGRFNLALALARETESAPRVGFELEAVARARRRFLESADLHDRLGRPALRAEVESVVRAMDDRAETHLARFARRLIERLEGS